MLGLLGDDYYLSAFLLFHNFLELFSPIKRKGWVFVAQLLRSKDDEEYVTRQKQLARKPKPKPKSKRQKKGEIGQDDVEQAENDLDQLGDGVGEEAENEEDAETNEENEDDDGDKLPNLDPVDGKKILSVSESKASLPTAKQNMQRLPAKQNHHRLVMAKAKETENHQRLLVAKARKNHQRLVLAKAKEKENHHRLAKANKLPTLQLPLQLHLRGQMQQRQPQLGLRMNAWQNLKFGRGFALTCLMSNPGIPCILK